MGAGILPITIYNGKIYFLFGKENKYENFECGWSDFGGGTDTNETFIETACREGSEELTGFLGSASDIKKMLKHPYVIDYKDVSGKHNIYRTHIFPLKYDPYLTFYYNNNQQFLQKYLDPKIIKSSKIFEKEEIKWVCITDLKKMKKQFRLFYQNIIDIILKNQKDIISHFQYIKNKNKTRKY